MPEEKATEDEIILRSRGPADSGARWLDIAGGILGLVVFLIGIALVYKVFTQATEMYADIGPQMQIAQNAPPAAEASDGETARPGGPSLGGILAGFGVRIAWLLFTALIGCLIAGLGAKLAGAHRGKRT